MQGASYEDRRQARKCTQPLDGLLAPASAAEAATSLVLPCLVIPTTRVTPTPEPPNDIGKVHERKIRCEATHTCDQHKAYSVVE